MIFCPECGTKNLDGALFCENCGAKLNENNGTFKTDQLKDVEVYQEEKVNVNSRMSQNNFNRDEEVTLSVDFSVWKNYSNNQKVLSISSLVLFLSYFMPFKLVYGLMDTTRSLFSLSSDVGILYLLPVIYIAFLVVIYMSVTKGFSNSLKLKINLIMFGVSCFLLFPFIAYILGFTLISDADPSERGQFGAYLSLIGIVVNIVFSYFEVLTYYFRKK